MGDTTTCTIPTNNCTIFYKNEELCALRDQGEDPCNIFPEVKQQAVAPAPKPAQPEFVDNSEAGAIQIYRGTQASPKVDLAPQSCTQRIYGTTKLFTNPITNQEFTDVKACEKQTLDLAEKDSDLYKSASRFFNPLGE